MLLKKDWKKRIEKKWALKKKVDFLKKRKSWKKVGFAPAAPVGDDVSPTIWGVRKCVA